MIEEWKADHPFLNGCIFYVILWPIFLLCGIDGIITTFSNLAASTPDKPYPVMWWYLVPEVCIFGLMILLKPRMRSRTHGAAHFATLRELKKAQLVHRPVKVDTATTTALLPAPDTTAIAPVIAQESLLEIGKRGRSMIALTERQQEQHVLIVAPSGKRKSSGFFIPALLQERGHRSLIINDVKDELYRLTAGAISRYHKVFVFSPTQPGRSNGYNPLAHIESSKDARDFARTWVQNTGVSEEAFYNEASQNLIAAVALHLIDTEENPPLSRLADFLAIKTLDEIKTLLLASNSTRARNTAYGFIQTIEANPKVSSGIMLGVANRFSILVDSEDYRETTAYDDIDFSDLVDGERPTALYLNIPVSATEDLKPLTSVFITQIMNFLTKRAEEEPDGRLPRHVAFYFDEFANAGKIPDIERHLTLVRGAGIAFILAIQDFGQLDRLYGRDIRDTVLSGTTTQITLPGVGQREAEYFSKRLGLTTVYQQSTGTSTRPVGLLGSERTLTTTQTEAKRPLMLPEEIRQMPVGSFVMVSDNLPPVCGTFHTYIDRPRLRDLTAMATPRVISITEEPEDQQEPDERQEPEYKPEEI